MPYQLNFNPSEKFYTFVQPFLSKLPKTPSDTPLCLETPLTQLNSVRYQWYNWMTHTCPNQYKVKATILRDKNLAYLEITHKGSLTPRTVQPSAIPGKSVPLHETGYMPTPVDETDAALQELAKQIEKDLSCKEDFSANERKPVTLKDL